MPLNCKHGVTAVFKAISSIIFEFLVNFIAFLKKWEQIQKIKKVKKEMRPPYRSRQKHIDSLDKIYAEL